MWNLIPRFGVATAIIDFTNELSPLLVGLESLVLWSAGMIIGKALWHNWRTRSPLHLGEKRERGKRLLQGALLSRVEKGKKKEAAVR